MKDKLEILKLIEKLDKYVDGSDWDIGHHEALEELKKEIEEK